MTAANRPLRVWIAESNLQVRQTLRLFLEERLNYQVVGDCAEVTNLLEHVQQADLDLLLMAWELPGCSPAKLIAELHELHPQMKVVCLSSQLGAGTAAMAAGADAFASKADNPLRLKAAIDVALAKTCAPASTDSML